MTEAELEMSALQYLVDVVLEQKVAALSTKSIQGERICYDDVQNLILSLGTLAGKIGMQEGRLNSSDA